MVSARHGLSRDAAPLKHGSLCMREQIPKDIVVNAPRQPAHMPAQAEACAQAARVLVAAGASVGATDADGNTARALAPSWTFWQDAGT